MLKKEECEDGMTKMQEKLDRLEQQVALLVSLATK